MAHIVIIGNGISGITAARHIRKISDDEITVISGETDYFFSRTALMYIYMGHMKYEHTKPYEDWFWIKNRIELKKKQVSSIDFKQKELIFEQGEKMSYDKLVLALGGKPNKFGWPGQALKGVTGLYSFQDLERIEEFTQGIQRAVIVGGGLIGIELAEMLHSRNIPVTFLVREKSFWDIVLPPGESQMVNREILDHHIDLRLSTELKEIVSDENGRAKAVITNAGDRLDCQFVGLTAGVSPNIAWLEDSELETGRGILVDEFLQTNQVDVYAIGDCVELRNPMTHRRPIEQVWYTGRMMGETVARTIAGDKTAYKPGVWFNSAKFFNIEYQTYGTVTATPQVGQESFYWEDQQKKLAVRIVFDETSGETIGMNTFGIRMRHEVWNRWLEQKMKISEVIENLEDANFDPEFFKHYEDEIRNSFYQQFPYFERETMSKV